MLFDRLSERCTDASSFQSQLRPCPKGDDTAVMTTSQSYRTPDWAGAPRSAANWTLMEVKNGVEMTTYSLTKSCTTFGRTEDCDIPLLHGSISRLHARIAFDSTTGAPWLKDLESTHGVMVNKKRLPPSSVSRYESNSTIAGARGVRVFPGDILQFGASTRIYCLQGPAEYERNRMAAQSTVVSETVSLLIETSSDPEKTSTRSTGINSTSPLAEDDHETLCDAVVPPTHTKQWEQLKALRYKLENLERESNRINAKANVQELTDGQERQLDKNQASIDQIKGTVDTLEEELKKVIFGSSVAVDKRCKNHLNHQENEDEEDVVDRTRDFRDDEDPSNKPEQSMSEEAMTSTWVALCREYQSVTAQVTSLARTATTLQTKIQTASEEDACAFFLKNDLELNLDNLARLKNRASGIESKIAETERLLRLINGEIIFEREKCRIIVDATPDRGTKQVDDVANPLALPSAPTFNFVAPKPILSKREKQHHLDTKSTALADQTDFDCTRYPSPTKRPKTAVAMEQPVVKPYVAPPPLNASSLLDKAVFIPGSSENKHDRWQAPNDQDGSGRTKLNDKFKGRY